MANLHWTDGTKTLSWEKSGFAPCGDQRCAVDVCGASWFCSGDGGANPCC